MGKAIERTLEATTMLEKERAVRRAAAWGVLRDITTRCVRLKQAPVRHFFADEHDEVNDIGFPELVFPSSSYRSNALSQASSTHHFASAAPIGYHGRF